MILFNLIFYKFLLKDIPFAEPPINENRFKKPVQKKSWNDIKDGTIWPNACMQPGGLYIPGINISEDCLYLNVFVSAKSYMRFKNNIEPKKPILLFIHGGNFVSGTSVYYDPSINIALSDIIYITIQYRLGPFGFMHLAGSDISGNQGFLDQYVALKWVKYFFVLKYFRIVLLWFLKVLKKKKLFFQMNFILIKTLADITVNACL